MKYVKYLCNVAVFNTSHYREGMGSDDDDIDPPTCQYRGNTNIKKQLIEYP